MDRIHAYIIFLIGSLSVYMYMCDTDTITIYLSNRTVSGTQDDLAGTCNTTGLSGKEIVLAGTSSPILAWIGAYATYSPWIEYKGCGKIYSTIIPLQIDFTQKNVSTEPDIFKCFELCVMNFIKHNYIGFQRNKCLCYLTFDIEEIIPCDNTSITVCGDNQNFICGEKDNVTVIYEIENLTMIATNDTGECGIVQINDNNTTFSSMECSNKAAILCFGNETTKAYPNRAENWEQTVKFCRTQDELITSIENAMDRSLVNITNGTYWVAAIRGISFRSLPAFDNDFCVASIIENGKKMKPLVESCDVKLPVTCRAGSADRLGYGTSTEKGDTTTTMENVSVLSQSLTQQNVIIIIATGSTGFICLVLVVIVLIFKRRSVKNKNYSGNPQHSKHDRKDSNTHVYNTTQGNDVDDLNPTRKEIHVHTTTQDKDYDDVDPNSMEMRVYTTTKDNDYDDVDPNRMEMRVYTTTQAKDYDDLDPSRKEMHVYTTTHGKDYDDLNPNRKEMHVYTMTQSKDYDDLDPNRKEMHVYTTTHEKDYDDLDPNRKGMHVYTTTQDKDYDDLDPNRKEMHVYTTTQSKDYDDLDPNRKEMHVYTTTHEKDYDDLDPNRKEMHVYTTTQGKDYDDLDPNRKEMHVYTATQDNTSGYYTTIHADNT
ncbi:unnamed protein product [Mytilus edulis]|uniref:Uncharacterized protein n=1 Tax=Mytilus edulis TaxID=6550 RepID=A0A8S3TK37_MYTED|nr:unnamed protein product [Mytilus edulis]